MAKEETKTSKEENGASGGVNAEKLKALRATMDKIEKSYGKGSIMKLGDEKIEDIEVIPTGSIALNAALGVGGFRVDVLLKFMVRNRPEKQHWPFMLLLKLKKPEVLPHLWMPNMLLIAFMLKSWASMLKIYGFRNPTMANRHWKLQNN